MEEEEEIGRVIVDCALRVHTALGPGLMESAYEACLAHELRKHYELKSQVYLPVRYDGLELDASYRIDLLVGGRVLVELKSRREVVRAAFCAAP